MGTTLEAIAIIGNQAIYAHIGFPYRIGPGEEYKQLTSDHSLVNALLKVGQITAEEAGNVIPNEISLPNPSDKKMKFSPILE